MPPIWARTRATQPVRAAAVAAARPPRSPADVIQTAAERRSRRRDRDGRGGGGKAGTAEEGGPGWPGTACRPPRREGKRPLYRTTGGCCVGSRLNRRLQVTRSLENLSSGEKRAARRGREVRGASESVRPQATQPQRCREGRGAAVQGARRAAQSTEACRQASQPPEPCGRAGRSRQQTGRTRMGRLRRAAVGRVLLKTIKKRRERGWRGKGTGLRGRRGRWR